MLSQLASVRASYDHRLQMATEASTAQSTASVSTLAELRKQLSEATAQVNKLSLDLATVRSLCRTVCAGRSVLQHRRRVSADMCVCVCHVCVDFQSQGRNQVLEQELTTYKELSERKLSDEKERAERQIALLKEEHERAVAVLETAANATADEAKRNAEIEMGAAAALNKKKLEDAEQRLSVMEEEKEKAYVGIGVMVVLVTRLCAADLCVWCRILTPGMHSTPCHTNTSVAAAIERVQKQENSVAMSRVNAAVAELRAQNEAALAQLSRAHTDEIAALRQRHGEEVEQLRQRVDDAKAIGVLSDKVRQTAGALNNLQEKVAADAARTTAAAHAQLEVRENLVGQMEERSKERQQAAHKEAQQLHALLEEMKMTLKTQRSAHASERSRLEREQVRLTRRQEALKEEAEVLREDARATRERMFEQENEFEKQKRGLLKQLMEAQEAAATERRRFETERARLHEEREVMNQEAVVAANRAQDKLNEVRKQACGTGVWVVGLWSGRVCGRGVVVTTMGTHSRAQALAVRAGFQQEERDMREKRFTLKQEEEALRKDQVRRL